jgi:cytochrome P450
VLLYRVWITVYRIFIHPLRKYPGPTLYAASNLPQLVRSGLGYGNALLEQLHDQYGPVVRVGPDKLSYIDPRAWKDIHGHRTVGRGVFQKDASVMGKREHPDIIHADDANHSRQRRIFSHAFSDRALKEQEPLILGYVDLLVSKLNETRERQASTRQKNAIDMVRMYNFTTFDVMADLTFGEPLGMLKEGEYVPWVSNIFASIKFMLFGSFLQVYPFLAVLFTPLMWGSLREKMKKHEQFSNERVDRRLEYGMDRGDIWSLVQRNADTNKISRGEMYSNAQIFMIAGTETTATLLSGLTYLLCRNPDKMVKLVGELRSLESPENLNIATLQGLPYLNACLEEGLRLYPPVPMIVPRVTPARGAIVCDQFVPEGVSLGDSLETVLSNQATTDTSHSFSIRSFPLSVQLCESKGFCSRTVAP